MFVVTVLAGKLVVLDVWPTILKDGELPIGETSVIQYIKEQQAKFLAHLDKLGLEYVVVPFFQTQPKTILEITKVYVEEWIQDHPRGDL